MILTYRTVVKLFGIAGCITFLYTLSDAMYWAGYQNCRNDILIKDQEAPPELQKHFQINPNPELPNIEDKIEILKNHLIPPESEPPESNDP